MQNKEGEKSAKILALSSPAMQKFIYGAIILKGQG